MLVTSDDNNVKIIINILSEFAELIVMLAKLNLFLYSKAESRALYLHQYTLLNSIFNKTIIQLT